MEKQKKKHLRNKLLLLFSALIAIAVILSTITVFAAQSLVQSGLDASNDGVGHPYMRQMFKACEQHWVFFAYDGDLMYRTSTNGASWAAPITIADDGIYNYSDFGLWYDKTGGTLDVVWTNSECVGNDLYYRRGTPESDGTITWMAAAQTAVDGGVVIDQSYTVNDDTTSAIWGDNWAAQTFTTGSAYTCRSVSLKVLRASAPGDFTVSIRATDAGVPDGEDLCSATIDGDALLTEANGTWTDIDFCDGTYLTTATMYAIVTRATAGDAGNYVGWRFDNADSAYATGVKYGSINAGVEWTDDANSDFLFKVYGSNQQIIEPVVASNIVTDCPWVAFTLKDITAPIVPTYKVYFTVSETAAGVWDTPENSWPTDYLNTGEDDGRYIQLVPAGDSSMYFIHAEEDTGSWYLVGHSVAGDYTAGDAEWVNTPLGKPCVEGYYYAMVEVHTGNFSAVHLTWEDYQGLNGDAAYDTWHEIRYNDDPEELGWGFYADLLRDNYETVPTLSIYTDDGDLVWTAMDLETSGFPIIYRIRDHTQTGIGAWSTVATKESGDADRVEVLVSMYQNSSPPGFGWEEENGADVDLFYDDYAAESDLASALSGANALVSIIPLVWTILGVFAVFRFLGDKGVMAVGTGMIMVGLLAAVGFVALNSILG